MKKRFPGFTVLIERALRLACVLGVAALAAACGGGQPEEDDSADGASTATVQGTLSAGNRNARTNGVILSEKVRGGIVLSEANAPTSGASRKADARGASQKADAPAADDDEAADE
jgi:hypothetical protein